MMRDSERLTAEQKRKRRLARNRESARECRKRKKEYNQSLFAQLAHLEAENLQLRLKLKIGVDSSTVQDADRDDITSRLNVLLQEGGSEADIKKEIEELQEKYSDYGRDRRSSIDFHITQLRKCLLPTQTTRTLLWLMTCAPMFIDREGNEKTTQFNGDPEVYALWQDLMAVMEPSLEQKRKLVEYTADNNSPFPALQKATDDANNILDRLDELISNKNETLDSEMKKLHGILNARQIAKFIVWIDQNPAVMQMLEMIWPHIHLISANTKTSIESSNGDNQGTSSSVDLESNASAEDRPTGSMGSGSSIGSDSQESDDDEEDI
mmetsp:Transcript_24423/g.35890  ORF Transcript_24423/g.35890 Transcript_24423/m.35890 type:complete len:323 (-) Transcript_24423:118-1086(-)